MPRLNHPLLLATLTLTFALSPARPAAAQQPDAADALTVEQLLRIADHESLLRLMASRADALAAALEQATDEASARRVAPLAQRHYLETEMIAIRISMLPRPGQDERAPLQPLYEQFKAAFQRANKQCERLATLPDAARHLQGVMLPLHVQVRDEYAARANSLFSQLQTIRCQIELYKLQHNDKLPDFRTQGWTQLTKPTNANGEVGKGDMGPYITQPPINPLNGQSRILLTHKPLKPGFKYEKGDCGFVIDDTTGKVWALTPDGTIFNEHRDPSPGTAQTDAR